MRAVIAYPSIQKDHIRSHYDLATVFYRLLWGRHIHHGLWNGDESPRLAQQNLTDTLARLAEIASGEKVLDVGCGMGASSVHLARSLGCEVTGITLSPLQCRWARWASYWRRVNRRTHFLCADAEQIEFPRRSFDVLWSVECTEHLFDKPRFFRRASEWLRPGGRMAICAWMAADAPQEPGAVRQIHDVCEAFLCPSLGTAADYTEWMEQAGLELLAFEDWTARVVKTWEICRRRVERSRVRRLAKIIDARTVLFLDRFETILQAYRSGAMKYGCFIARSR